MKKFNIWSLLLLLPFILGLFATLAGDMFYETEKAVFNAIRVLAPGFDMPSRIITEIGSAIGVIAVTGIIFIVSAINKKYFFSVGLPVALTVIISRVVNIIIKIVIDRPRPDFKVLEVSEASFPSGHAQNNMALYIAVLLTLLLIVTLPKWRLALKILLIAVPIIIGITRIYFGVHYLSDVIAGWGMGAFVAILVNNVYFKVYYFIKDRKNAKT